MQATESILTQLVKWNSYYVIGNITEPLVHETVNSYGNFGNEIK